MKQEYCLEKNKDIYGWNALYDVSKSSVLSAGTILLCGVKANRALMFELDEDLDLFLDANDEIYVEALPGSTIANDFNGDGWYVDDPVAKIPLSSCRFPTKKELADYEKMVSV